MMGAFAYGYNPPTVSDHSDHSSHRPTPLPSPPHGSGNPPPPIPASRAIQRPQDYARTPLNAYPRKSPGFYAAEKAAHARIELSLDALRAARRSNLAFLENCYRFAYDVQTSPHHEPWRIYMRQFSAPTLEILDDARAQPILVPAARDLRRAEREVTAALRGTPGYSEDDLEYIRRWRMAAFGAALKETEYAYGMDMLKELAWMDTVGWEIDWDLREGDAVEEDEF